MKTLGNSIFAENGEIGKYYLTPLGKKVQLVRINRMEGEKEALSVTVKYDEASNPIAISGQTALYPYVQSEKEEEEKQIKENNTTTNKKEKKVVEKSEKKSKMSDLMNPMIFEGKTAEETADAVIAVYPDKAAERDKLIQQIKGPRTYNLKKKHPEKFQSQEVSSKAEATS